MKSCERLLILSPGLFLCCSHPFNAHLHESMTTKPSFCKSPFSVSGMRKLCGTAWYTQRMVIGHSGVSWASVSNIHQLWPEIPRHHYSTLQPENITYINFPEKLHFSYRKYALGVNFPKITHHVFVCVGKGEVRVYRGTGVSHGVRRTTWDRSLKIWELQIPCFEEFFWGGNTLGLVPASLPHALGYACTFYTPTSLPQL